MIKNIDHAIAVATSRQAQGLRGIPRAVARYLKRSTSVRDWKPTFEGRVQALGLPYNAPL